MATQDYKDARSYKEETPFGEDASLNSLWYYRRLAIDYKESRFLNEWTENISFYRGGQWEQKHLDSIAFWRSASVNNVIFSTVEQVHSLMTDDQTSAFVKRVAGGSFTTEQILDSIVTQIWDKRKVPETDSKVKKDCLYFGTGFFKVWYNKFLKDEPLKIDVKRISPFDFYIDPLANCIEDARFIFERERTSKAELIKRYPDKLDMILSGVGETNNPIGDEGSKLDSSSFDFVEIAYLWHCYIKELTFVVNDYDDVDEKDIKKMIRKYPNCRCVVMYGTQILEDYPYEYPFYPYVRQPLIEMPDEFFGLSLVTPMKEGQVELNQIESAILDNIKTNTNPIFRATEGVVDADEFVPIPNSLVTMKNKDDIFDRLPGVQLPQEVFVMVDKKREEIMARAGISDVTFGSGAQSSRPGTVKANFNASITRIREYLRLSHRAIEEVGRMIIKIAQISTPADTMIEISNKDNLIFDFGNADNIDFLKEGINDPKITKNLEIGQVVLNQKNPDFQAQLTALIDSGQSDSYLKEADLRTIILRKGIAEFKNDISQGSYDYCVSSHPIQVQDPNQMLELLTTLLQYGNADPTTGSPGMIDFQYALENMLNVLPNKKDLIARLKKKQKMLEANLAAQNQAQPGQQPQPQQQGR